MTKEELMKRQRELLNMVDDLVTEKIKDKRKHMINNRKTITYSD